MVIISCFVMHTDYLRKGYKMEAPLEIYKHEMKLTRKSFYFSPHGIFLCNFVLNRLFSNNLC